MITQKELSRILKLKALEDEYKNIAESIRTRLSAGEEVESGRLVADLIKSERTPNWRKEALAAYVTKFGASIQDVIETEAKNNKNIVLSLKVKSTS